MVDKMTIHMIEDINTIIPLHKEIFGTDFPINSYYKKKKEHNLYIFVYEYGSILFGYSIIVDQSLEKNLYAWYGGVLPNAQGQGITNLFFDKLIELAIQKGYVSVTVASYNTRPHMLRFAIKKGFDIFDIKKRDYGYGDKIYFRYLINPPSIRTFKLIENERYVKPAELELELVKAYKSNCKTFIYEGTSNYETLYYAIIYCNSFADRPKIIIHKEKSDLQKLNDLIELYLGEIKIE